MSFRYEIFSIVLVDEAFQEGSISTLASLGGADLKDFLRLLLPAELVFAYRASSSMIG